MEKVRLSLDELQVQSFATDEPEDGRGTVHAHDAPTDRVECPTSNRAWDTCWDTCGDSCGCGSGGPSGDCTVDCYSAWGWWSSLCW
ncbi:MAG TPA: pinensin family lanthipeptide [Longimicrobium sp.]|jgi:hypothetical protein|nr:pinensin family lanthipeptide [Longimicrobium sp.]